MQLRRFTCVIALVMGMSGCTAEHGASRAKVASEPTPVPVFTPVPTVVAGTPAPETPAPLPTRPVGNPEEVSKAKKAGKLVGPVITLLGLSRADGKEVSPSGTEGGIPVYTTRVGSGFQLIVEVKVGSGGYEPGKRLTASEPMARPDLEMEFSRPLGDGSAAVCDKRRPQIGGVPAINPTNWKESQKISDTLLDASCRFETFIESSSSCTVNKRGDFSFVKPDSMVQYCMVVAKAWEFQEGDTTVSARVRDVEGNPGPVAQLIIRRLPPGTPVRRERPTKTPTPVRRRP